MPPPPPPGTDKRNSNWVTGSCVVPACLPRTRGEWERGFCTHSTAINQHPKQTRESKRTRVVDQLLYQYDTWHLVILHLALKSSPVCVSFVHISQFNCHFNILQKKNHDNAECVLSRNRFRNFSGTRLSPCNQPTGYRRSGQWGVEQGQEAWQRVVGLSPLAAWARLSYSQLRPREYFSLKF